MRFFKFPLFISKQVINDKNKLQIVKRQVDFFLSTRVKRSIEVYNFYRNNRTFQELIKHLRQNFNFRNRLRLSALGAAGISAFFDWEKERLTLDDSAKYFLEEFDRIDRLKAQAEFAKSGKTPNGNNAEQHQNNTKKQSDEEENKGNREKSEMESWEFYVQRDNMITWRREEEEGHYAYKVYVSYPDITAEDFLFVQNDIDYRKEWDDTAVALRLVETDEEGDQSQPGAIIYWEMMWPKLFSNRDYVFNRKTFIDQQRNVVLIVNRSTKHPDCPPVNGLQRVKEFWSYMVIKPKTNCNEPGLEFILTYYDNPGIKIPKYVTSWVAQRQLPDFIDRLYLATLNYSKKKSQRWYKQDPGFEYPSDVRLDEHSNNGGDNDVYGDSSIKEFTEPDNEANEDSKVQNQNKSWWRYLLFYNYLY